MQNMSNKSAEGMRVVEHLCQRIQKDGVLSLFPTWNEMAGSGSAK